MKPSDFILTSDYGTLKNDSGVTTLSVFVPNGRVFNPSNPLLGFQEASVGTINAPIRALMNTTTLPSTWAVCTFLYSDYNYTVSGEPGVRTGFLYCSLYRPSPSVVRLEVNGEYANIPNNFTVVGDVTITARFTTFLSPLD